MFAITDRLLASLQYGQDGLWHDVPDSAADGGIRAELPDGVFELSFRREDEHTLSYTLRFSAPRPTKLRLTLCPATPAEAPFHLIPCNIYGDNNASLVRPGEFPLLTDLYPGARFCSPLWEFRADRAAVPVSALCADSGVFGVSVDPYAPAEEGRTIRNGVFSRLPDRFGITLGYTNRPTTFSNKTVAGQPVGDSATEASVSGRIYEYASPDRQNAHRIIRGEYALRHDRATHRKSLREAADGLFDTFVGLNWDAERGEYTNRCCRPRDWTTLRPWRMVTEVGWTGGGVLALPMLMYEYLTPGFTEDRYRGARSAAAHFDRICSRYNPASGMLYDLCVPNDAGSDVNGWWTGYGLVKDCHCSYNTGTAVYSLAAAACFLRSLEKPVPPLWTDTLRKVLDTAVTLQREDGAFGYTYAVDEKKVTDWEGFAGCWFVPALALFYRLTGEQRWLDAGLRGLRYYAPSVLTLNCFGTPMDTWKSVDEEGNLAFIKGCRYLWEETRDEEVLTLFKAGAEYEYLWRYGYRTRPEYEPIRKGWTACGGSVTSVSNPHIHPMGLLVDTDLAFLAKITGDDYHLSRSLDGTAWILQTLELYPEKTGYGQYGVLSERWCPSDGLLEERYSDDSKYSSWFSYNLWAAAAALQAVCDRLWEGGYPEG